MLLRDARRVEVDRRAGIMLPVFGGLDDMENEGTSGGVKEESGAIGSDGIKTEFHVIPVVWRNERYEQSLLHEGF